MQKQRSESQQFTFYHSGQNSKEVTPTKEQNLDAQSKYSLSSKSIQSLRNPSYKANKARYLQHQQQMQSPKSNDKSRSNVRSKSRTQLGRQSGRGTSVAANRQGLMSPRSAKSTNDF